MAGLAVNFSLKKLTWKCSEFWNVCPKQNCILRAAAIRPYSKEKNSVPVKKSVFSQAIKDGLRFGNWKFYFAEEIVFKNLRPDTVPPSYKMCYRSGLETYANFAILIAGGGVVAMPAFAAYSFYCGNDLFANLEEVIPLATGLILSAIALWKVSFQVPLRIYYSSECENFIVFVPRLIPWTTRRIVIQPGRVTPPTKSSMYFPWVNQQHVHTDSKKTLLLDGEKFILPMYYNKLMGY